MRSTFDILTEIRTGKGSKNGMIRLLNGKPRLAIIDFPFGLFPRTPIHTSRFPLLLLGQITRGYNLEQPLVDDVKGAY